MTLNIEGVHSMNIKSLRQVPINIDLLRVSEEDVKQLKPISEIQIFNNTNQFHHPEGYIL